MAESQTLSNTIWRTNLKANMAGQLFVSDVELPRAKLRLSRTLRLKDETTETFLNLPFTEAIEHFRRRNLVTPQVFEALIDSERFRSFTATRALSQVIVGRMKAQLEAAMQPGGPGLAEFIREFVDDVTSPSIQRDGESDSAFAQRRSRNQRSYLDNVYRTSTATSYNGGRLRMQTHPDVIASGAIWEYSTAGDERVRSSHQALHGKQWAINDGQALRVYPCNGYRCRCSMLVIDPLDRDESAMNREVDVDAAITQGFDGPPDTN